MNQVVSVFPNSDLRGGHNRLGIEATKSGKNPATLEPGSFLLFINRKQSAFKMFAANNTLVHYKSPRGRIHVDAIRYLPHCFNGTRLNFDKAIDMSLTKLLKRKI